MPTGPPAKAPSDEELARRAQQGCTASFEELVRRFQVPLLHFLRRWTSTEEAEDLVQDTFVRAYRNLHRYRPTARLATWLFTIARRLSINRQRKRRPVVDSEVLELVEADVLPPSQIVADRESRQRLWDLADEVLSERQRTALWLYYVEDMSVVEVARVVGHSRGAVKTMLFRARRKLAAVLEPAEMETQDKIAEYTNG